MNRQPDDPGPSAYLSALSEQTDRRVLLAEIEWHMYRADHAENRWMFWKRLAQVAAIATLVSAGAWQKARAETVDGNRIMIIDGDTVALPCAQPAPGCSERVRLLNIDAPESFRPNCEAERKAGLAAKARLAQLVRGQAVEVIRCEPDTKRCEDRYHRTLARLTTAAGDVGQILIAEQLALPWATGSEAKAGRVNHWCGGK